MEKYIFNSNIHGYNNTTVEDFEKLESNGNMLIAVVDKSLDEKLSDYYRIFDRALRSNNRIILIGVDDGNVIFRPLASLLVTFRDYDIYQVENKDTISARELLKIEERTPDLNEVQTFIGGDVTAYSDMSTILFGIENLVEEGNIDKLKGFLEEHLLSIENFTSTLNGMKKTCDLSDSKELMADINKLKEHEEKLNLTIAEKDKNIEEVKYDRDKYKVSTEELKRENDKLKASNATLKDAGDSTVTTSVINNFSELNVDLIRCRVQTILYFKEISYVRYMNTLVEAIESICATKKLKTKVMIYEAQNGVYTHTKLRAVSGKDYAASKRDLLKTVKKFIVAEPDISIIKDFVESEENIDVLIIYDRLGCTKDIVTGHRVTKYYVINSLNDYEAVKSVFKINDTSKVITYADCGIPGNYLDIPKIDKYETLKKADDKGISTAAVSKYNKLETTHSKVALVGEILKASLISEIRPGSQSK
jgi:hypothetical protein